MKKFLFCLMLSFTLCVGLVCAINNHYAKNFIPRTTIADSGFDADYDYGGGDYGGGDWSSGDNDSGFSSSSEGSTSSVMGWIILIIVVSVWIYAITKNKKGNPPRGSAGGSNSTPVKLPESIGVDDDLNKMAYDMYVAIQNAWTDRNLEHVRHLLTDEMFNMYQMQVETLVDNGQINVMSNFVFVDGYISERGKEVGASDNGADVEFSETETLKIILTVSCRDYIIDDKTKKVIKGSSSVDLLYTYELTFVKDKIDVKEQRCPGCGAELNNQKSNVCPHCGNVLHTKSDSYTLSNKVMLSQRRK